MDNLLYKYESLHRIWILDEKHQVINVLFSVYNLYCNFFLLLLLAECDDSALYIGLSGSVEVAFQGINHSSLNRTLIK